jgi:glycine oxidase
VSGTVRAVEAADVAVVGGGPIGLAIAWRTAVLDPGRRVVVVDPAPGGGAAGVAAGLLAAVTEAHFGEEALTRLSVASAERWPSFASELEQASGRPTGFTAGGTVVAAYDADDNAVLAELFQYQRTLGLDVERLHSSEVRRLEPAVSPRVRGGILAAGDHRVDPRSLCAALVAGCERAGVELTRHRVERIITDGDRLRGVATAHGVVAAERVVVAAGTWSASIAGLPPGAVPPVRPVKGQILTLRSPPGEPPLITRAVRGVVRGSSVYLVPRDDGRVIVGATVEDRGWDTQPTAGGVYDLLRDAVLLVPGVTELELVEVQAGLRPGSPDNLPIIGPVPLDGLVVATGHYRNGILLTPITADAVARLLAGGTLPEEVSACSPRRFATTEVFT